MANSYNFPFANVTNSDLHILLNNNTVHRFPLPTVDNMVFNPFLLNDNNLRNSDNRSDEMSIPDFQEPRCNYHFINTMNSTYQAPPNSLNLLSYNIRSIPSQINAFQVQCLN